MKYILELNHPKHYYQFKHIRKNLINCGNEVVVLARDKDVLLSVLQEENVDYLIFGRHRKNMAAKIWGTLSILWNYAKIVKHEKPDVIITKASFYGVFMAKIFGKKSIIFPDSEVVTVTNKFVVPLCDKVVTPETFGLNYGKKHIKVPGFFENCYLAPSVFIPNKKIIQQYGLKRPYAIFRFVGWFANHDVHNGGFSLEEKLALVKAVEPFMTVYISSEKEMPEELKNYKLPTPASQIHSVLSFADLYLGDSQTMATEAALLATPSIRSNSFVGEHDMTNFIVLEKKYNLLCNRSNFEEVLALVTDFASKSRKEEWIIKQEKYNQEVGDLNKIITDIILNL
jgi:predicted glycosyltransferase